MNIIEKSRQLLDQSLPYENTDHLRAYLVAVEDVRPELAGSRCEALYELQVAEGKMLHPKDKDLTELDRRIYLQTAVSDLRKAYEYVLAIEELVKERIELGKLFLTSDYER